jgi:hypothetical protein
MGWIFASRRPNNSKVWDFLQRKLNYWKYSMSELDWFRINKKSSLKRPSTYKQLTLLPNWAFRRLHTLQVCPYVHTHTHTHTQLVARWCFKFSKSVSLLLLRPAVVGSVNSANEFTSLVLSVWKWSGSRQIGWWWPFVIRRNGIDFLGGCVSRSRHSRRKRERRQK